MYEWLHHPTHHTEQNCCVEMQKWSPDVLWCDHVKDLIKQFRHVVTSGLRLNAISGLWIAAMVWLMQSFKTHEWLVLDDWLYSGVWREDYVRETQFGHSTWRERQMCYESYDKRYYLECTRYETSAEENWPWYSKPDFQHARSFVRIHIHTHTIQHFGSDSVIYEDSWKAVLCTKGLLRFMRS